MVRRVGFGDTDKSPKDKRIDDQPTPVSQAGGGKRTTRLIVGAFLLVWLTAWSAAIAFSIDEIMDQGLGAADTGLFVWVAVASVFWVIAVSKLRLVLTGRPFSDGKSKRPSKIDQRGHGLDRGDWDYGAND